MLFTKCTFSGPQLSRRGLVWYLLDSSKARALRGLDKSHKRFLYYLLKISPSEGFLYDIQSQLSNDTHGQHLLPMSAPRPAAAYLHEPPPHISQAKPSHQVASKNGQATSAYSSWFAIWFILWCGRYGHCTDWLSLDGTNTL